MAILRNSLHDEQATLVTVSLVVLAAVAIAMGLSFTRPVMVPLVVAIIVYYLVSPIADLLELRLRFTRWLSTFFVMLLVGAKKTSGPRFSSSASKWTGNWSKGMFA